MPAEQTNIADWIMDLIIVDEDRAKSITAHGDEETLDSGNRLLPIHCHHLRSGGEKVSFKYNRDKKSFPKYTASFSTQLKMITRLAVKQTRGGMISNASIIATCACIIFESAFWFRLTNVTNHIYKETLLFSFSLLFKRMEWSYLRF